MGSLKHLDIAEAQIGIKERRGDKHHPRILAYHATTTLGDWARSRDETPWCSSFVNYCVTKAGREGTDNALARSWIRWGEKVAIEDWQLGDVIVIKRRKRGSDAATGSRGGYHVLFLYRLSGRYLAGIGGNQRDRVSFARYSRRRYDIIAIRR